MKKKIIAILFFLGATISYGFNLGIAPTNFQLDLNKPQTREVTILNNTDKPMRVEVFPEKPEDLKDEGYIGESIRIYPKIVNIKAFGRQVVKFAVRTPGDLPSGNYRSYLVFKELPSKPSESENRENKPQLNITMLTELAITIYGKK